MPNTNIVILGGGLSGLTTAYLLKKEKISATVLEGRNRLGGRIHTFKNNNEGPIELGATWLGKKHSHLLQLLDELDINIREQYMGSKGFYEPMSMTPPQLVDLPANEEPSFRIEGGTETVINKLAETLHSDQLQLGQQVTSIHKNSTKVKVETNKEVFEGDIVISTLPPKVLVDSISFYPSLPEQLSHIARSTHTWMAESIKVALTFDHPFWRKENSSGTIFSNVGPVTEMYDHSTMEKSNYALKGFMDDSYHSISRQKRKSMVLDQLHRFYGDKADTYNSYREQVWKHEPLSYSEYDTHIIPHQHNGHQVFQKSYLNNQFIISGSETATAFPGYMDGAVESAERSVRQVKNLLH